MKKGIIYILGGLMAITVGAVIYKNNSSTKTTQTQTNNDKTINEEKKIDIQTPVCDQITSSFVENALGKKIIKSEKITSSGTNVCQYYVDDSNFVTLRLNALDYENQKKGQETLGRKITTNSQIPMEHFIAVQENGLINGIYLKIDNNLFLAVDRTSTKAANEDEIISFAAKVVDLLKTGKFQSGSVLQTSNTNSQQSKQVPLPQETDIINSFFRLMEEGRASDSVNMMSSKNIANDSAKQAWAVLFNAMKSVKVKSAEPILQEDWTDNRHEYKVMLDLVMDPSSAGAPIPYYGYENGENVRFIILVKENNLWKVDEIATGP